MRDLRNRLTRLRRARRLTLALAILATSTALAQSPESHSLRLLPPLPLQPISSGHVQPNPFCDSKNGVEQDAVKLASGNHSIRLKKIDGSVGLHGIGESGKAKLTVQPAPTPTVRSNPLVQSRHLDNENLVETDLIENGEPLPTFVAPVEPTIHSRGSGKKSKVVLIPPVKSEVPEPEPALTPPAEPESSSSPLAECAQPEAALADVELAEEFLSGSNEKENAPAKPEFESISFSLSDRSASNPAEPQATEQPAPIGPAPVELAPVELAPAQAAPIEQDSAKPVAVTPLEIEPAELGAITDGEVEYFESEDVDLANSGNAEAVSPENQADLRDDIADNSELSSEPSLIPVAEGQPAPVILTPPKAIPMPTRPAERVVTLSLSDQSEDSLDDVASDAEIIARGSSNDTAKIPPAISHVPSEHGKVTSDADQRDALPKRVSPAPRAANELVEQSNSNSRDAVAVAAPIRLNPLPPSQSSPKRRDSGEPVAVYQRADDATASPTPTKEESFGQADSNLHYQRYRPPVAVKSVPLSFEQEGALQATPVGAPVKESGKGLVGANVKLTPLFMKSAQVRSLTVAGQLRDVRIADKSVCQAIASGPNQLKLIGTGNGVTQLVVWASTDDPDSPVRMRAFEVHVDQVDPAVATGGKASRALQQSIRNAFPNCRVQFTQQAGELIVSGNCDSEKSAEKIIRMVRKTCLVPVQDRLTIR